MSGSLTLDRLFPEEDYGFRMRFEQGRVTDYFGQSHEHGRLIPERRQWLRNEPSKYAALLPEGVPLLVETLSLAESINSLPCGILASDLAGLPAEEQIVKLGELWEPDFLLLRAVADGSIRLFGGCVCFPSSWSLEEKIGRPIEEIHGVVPGLNANIGAQIQRFLSKLRPGTVWLRSNWGLSRSAELNQHPSRKLPRLDETVEPGEIWLRIEDQALVALPATGGILFGIRLLIYPFLEVLADASLAKRFIRALETMPQTMAHYKGLAAARERLISLAKAGTSVLLG